MLKCSNNNFFLRTLKTMMGGSGWTCCYGNQRPAKKQLLKLKWRVPLSTAVKAIHAEDITLSTLSGMF